MNQVTGSSHGTASSYKNLNFKKSTSKSKLQAVQQHGCKNKDGVVTVELNEAERLQKQPKELVGGTAEKRNWRGIIISLLVILLICSLIVVAIIVATPGAEEHVFEKFTFDDIFDEQYKPQYFDAVWFSENEYIMRDSTNNIVAVDISGNKSSILITNRTMEWKLYRSSFEAIYKIYEVSTK
ncbi:A-type potassium channel modulatory protein DPP6-like [Diadema antillarum]|uniref:A-type potassium channel modulatory protein DPP6-like n=1 Tax=Diadema antillarum TaxID=105358 RepID=UPI003A844638